MKNKRVISFILSLLILLNIPTTIMAKSLIDYDSESDSDFNIDDIRNKVIEIFEEKFDDFIIHDNTDNIFEYSYSLNGEVYKIVEYFNDPNDKMNSSEEVFMLDSTGEYIKVETIENKINWIEEGTSTKNLVFDES